MSVPNLTLALEANLQAEIGAKNAQIAILDGQERAITARDVDALADATHALQAHAQRDIDRAAKRAAILADLARTLGIAGAPRVGTIATALGSRGRTLASRRS